MDCAKFQEQITQLKELYTQAQEQIDQYNKTGDLEKYGYPGLENLDKLTDDTDRILEEYLPDFIDKNPDILKPYEIGECVQTDQYIHSLSSYPTSDDTVSIRGWDLHSDKIYDVKLHEDQLAVTGEHDLDGQQILKRLHVADGRFCVSRTIIDESGWHNELSWILKNTSREVSLVLDLDEELLAASPDDEAIIGGEKGQLQVVDLYSEHPFSGKIPGFNGDIKAAAYLSEGQALIGGTKYRPDGPPHKTKLKILDTHTKTLSKDILGVEHPIRHITASDNGRILVDDKKGILYNFDLETQTVQPIFQNDTKYPYTSEPIALSDNLVLLATSDKLLVFDCQKQQVEDTIAIDDAQAPHSIVAHAVRGNQVILSYKDGGSSYIRTLSYTPVDLDILKAKIPQILAREEGET